MLPEPTSRQPLKIYVRNIFQRSHPRYRTLVILSDGEDTSDREKDNGISTIVNLVGQADELNLHVFTVGLGSKVGGVIPNLIYEGKICEVTFRK